MKKFLNIIVFTMALVLMTVITSCDRVGKTLNPSFEPDTTLIATQVDRLMNPSFNSAQELLVFRNSRLECKTIDSIFTSLPDEVLQNAATVCINKKGYVTKKDVVNEYRSNGDVYNNLPKTAPPDTIKEYAALQNRPSDDPNIKEDPPRENTVTYSQRDTVIDGQHATVKTRVETQWKN